MDKGIVAFAGTTVLEKAIWDNVWGMYIQLKLEQRAHEKTTANPFKRFTKMRKGKVGTRFHAVFVNSREHTENPDFPPFYSDDVMLKSWGDGTTGWTLHLWVMPDCDGFHPWMHIDNKTEYALAMVELDDDEEAIDQDKRDRVVAGPKQRSEYTLSNYAAGLCRSPRFREWVRRYQEGSPEFVGIDMTDEQAAIWLRDRLHIKSRSELDTNEDVARLFHQSIRKPYAAWSDR